MKKYRAADHLFESKTPRGNERETKEINSIIIHTTGYGAGLKRIVEKHGDDLAQIGLSYAHRMASILKYKGHFLIDHIGVIYQFLPVSEVGWHTGSSKKRLLRSQKPKDWWKARWPDFEKPIDLPSWKTNSPNYNSVGIDLLAHGSGAISDTYTKAQYDSLIKLIKALCEDLEIPIERKFIVGHEDVDPISRSNKRGGWDPGNFDWEVLMTGLSAPEPELKPPALLGDLSGLPEKHNKPQMPKTGAGFLFKFLNRFLSALRGG